MSNRPAGSGAGTDVQPRNPMDVVKVHAHADAPHAFFADYSPSFGPRPAEDGRRRALAWLRRNGVA
jgi:dienelactone hydrolase